MNRGLGKGKAGNLTELSHGQLAAVQSEKHPSARGVSEGIKDRLDPVSSLG